MSTAAITKNRIDPTERTKRIVTLAMLAALAYAVMYVGRVPLWGFVNYDPKDVVIIISGFIYGPLSAATISVVVSFLEMITVSDTGPMGMLMNIISTCAFACTASFVYSRFRTKRGALSGLICGVAVVVPVMLLWNYIITPLYMETTRETVAAMLLPIFLPANLLKSCINMAITLLLYKPIITALRRVNLLPESRAADSAGGKVSLGITILALAILITAILIVLVHQGII